MKDELYIGMVSGTSRDGVDAVLVNFHGGSMDPLHGLCTPYPTAIKLTLDQLLETGQPPSSELASLLDENLGRFYARVAQNLVREAGMEMRDIRAIGAHGQTVWHEPRGENPVTLQLGKGDLIASNTGTTVVVGFRSADVKAGGQGTPLAPLLHRRLFYCETQDRVILNLGGIASLTILPSDEGVSGFDCGPGLCLLDAWTKRHLQKDHDNNGDWAAKGQINSNMVNRILQDPYFEEAPPRNTPLEYFDISWLESFVGGSGLNEVDVQASLVELTALSVARRLHDSGLPKRLLVCGGGVQNTFLISRIAAALPGVIVDSTTKYGADPEWLEGLLFAWLAHERLHGKVQDTPPITGASHPVLLGEIFEP